MDYVTYGEAVALIEDVESVATVDGGVAGLSTDSRVVSVHGVESLVTSTLNRAMEVLESVDVAIGGGGTVGSGGKVGVIEETNIGGRVGVGPLAHGLRWAGGGGRVTLGEAEPGDGSELLGVATEGDGLDDGSRDGIGKFLEVEELGPGNSREGNSGESEALHFDGLRVGLDGQG